jgi:cytochrome c oxidase subunit 2
MFYGQCSELCGRNHAFMPIAVHVVSEEEFADWLAKQKSSASGDEAGKVATTERSRSSRAAESGHSRPNA